MTGGPCIAVVDYGAGNLVSIEQALTSVGATVALVRDAEALDGCDAVIVPGVGAAGPAMERLDQAGLADPIRDWLQADRPHIGWNQVQRRRDHRLLDGIEDGADFYFVHSYAGAPDIDEADAVVVADTTHGRPFVSVVARGHTLGVQFHPERSGSDGLRLLANFVELVKAA